MCIKFISNYYHKKYHIPYIFFILMVIMSLTLIILNPFHAIANKYPVKIIFCIISICIIACVSRCLCIIIDESIQKKQEEIYFTNYRSINNLSTFIFDYSQDELPTTYGSINT